jgi:Icc-related predicted phosphoesterase
VLAKTRLFFITDVHGSDRCFRKFLNSAKFYGANVLILGGDITGKVIVPIIKRRDGTYVTRHIGNEIVMKGESEVAETKRNVSDSGAYPYVTDVQPCP